jgi:integrase
MFYLNRNSIFTSFSIAKNKYSFATGITTTNWNVDEQRVSKVDDFYWEKNRALEVIERAAIQLMKKSQVEGSIPSKEFVKVYLKGLAEINYSKEDIIFVHEFISEWRKRKEKVLSNGYVRNFKSLEDSIKEYAPTLTFAKLGTQFLEEFTTWLLEERDVLNNTVAGYVKRIRRICKDASKSGILINPYYDDFKFKETSHDPIWLDWDRHLPDLEKLELNERLDKVRDRFLFRCYTGIREGEMNKLLPQNFYSKGKQWYLKYFMTKGMKNKNIQLNEKAMAILFKYEFNLPKMSQQKENMYLKEVTRKAKLTEIRQIIRYQGNKPVIKMIELCELVSGHTARRTFARRWYENGGDLKKLQLYLGHSSIKTTEIYIGVEDDEVNDEMMRVI